MTEIMNQDNYEDGVLTRYLTGRITADVITDIEVDVLSSIEANNPEHVVLNFGDVEYISSAGLRMIMKLVKQGRDVSIIEVSDEVYEITEMTGFTSMMTIEKKRS